MRPPAINLARRPFRNNTVHYAVFGACAALLLAATGYNVNDFVRKGGELGRLQQELEEHTTRYNALAAEVRQMRKDIETVDLTVLNTKSKFANGLILSHLFSWSTLFERMEDLTPPDVKIRSIRPSISSTRIEIQIDGLARVQDALYEFEENLGKSDYFTGVYPVSENSRETKNELNFILRMDYIPAGKSGAEPLTPPTPTAAMPQSESTPQAGGAADGNTPAQPAQDEPGAAAPGGPGEQALGNQAEAAPASGSPASLVPSAVPSLTAPQLSSATGSPVLSGPTSLQPGGDPSGAPAKFKKKARAKSGETATTPDPNGAVP